MLMKLKQEPDNEEVLTNSLIWPETNESTFANYIDSIGMPPTLPEEEQLLVINACKIEQFEDGDKMEQIPQQEAPLSVAELQLKSQPELEIEAMPKVEVFSADEPAEIEELNYSLVVKETKMQQEEETVQEIAGKESSVTSQKHLDWNAPGVGEFLNASTTPPVINQTSELGLTINEVFSLAGGTIPSLVPRCTQETFTPLTPPQ
ncbi:hypothetical protein ACLKA6_019394 [Drosophila palustris]